MLVDWQKSVSQDWSNIDLFMKFEMHVHVMLLEMEAMA